MTQVLKDRPWLLGVIVLIIAGLGYGIWSLTVTEAHEFNGTSYDPVQEISAFTLTNTDGEPMSTSELQGKVVLLYFGYTHCPDFCPATLTDFMQVKEQLGDDAGDVAFVMVSVDPERDTPARMQEFLANFDPGFIGLTGAEDELAPVKQTFGISAIPAQATPGAASYTVSHSTRTYALNQDGELALVYDWGTPAGDIVADVAYLLDS